MLPAEKLELAIYRHVKALQPPVNVTVNQFSQVTGETNYGRIVERLIDLEASDRILLTKYKGGSRLSRPEFGNDGGFFYTEPFLVEIAPQGRKYFEELEQRTENERPTPADQDRKFARLAIEEARKSVPENDGRPHPRVGAVMVKNGEVIATAHRGEVEGNHAEYLALEKKLADEAVAGAIVYTTLEPCTTRNHPKIPCAERLIERKVGRVVIGMLDPDPRITGRGQRKLRSANIITEFFPHDLMSEVEELNREFARQLEDNSSRAAASPPATFQPEIIDKWVNLGYEHKSGIAKTLEGQGFDLGWVTADKETEKVEFEGWEHVVVNQPDGKIAYLKIHDHPAVGGYLVLLKRRKASK